MAARAGGVLLALAIRGDREKLAGFDYYDLLFVAAPEGGVFAMAMFF